MKEIFIALFFPCTLFAQIFSFNFEEISKPKLLIIGDTIYSIENEKELNVFSNEESTFIIILNKRYMYGKIDLVESHCKNAKIKIYFTKVKKNIYGYYQEDCSVRSVYRDIIANKWEQGVPPQK